MLPSKLNWQQWPAQNKLELLAALRKKNSTSSDFDFSAYRDDPVGFVRDILGESPWPKQCEILESIRDNIRTAVKSAHGVGKSWVVSRALIWFSVCFDDSIVISTAPSFRQVTNVLWGEVRLAYKKALRKLPGELLQTKLKLGDKRYAMGFTARSDDAFQGVHAPRVLVIFDEAAGVDPQFWVAAQGVLTTDDSRFVAVGNPTEPSGPFYDMFRAEGVAKMTISAFDIPNVQQGKVVIPGLTTADWVEDKKRMWGETSPAYQSRVLGEFPDTSSDTVIPLSWVEAAQARWNENEGREQGRLDALGVDVGRGGDKSVLAPRHGHRLEKLRKSGVADVMATANVASNALSAGGTAVVDVIGIGAGVVDRLRELGHKVEPFNAAESTKFKDRSGELEFANKRAAAWWNMRELLDPANGEDIELPPDDLLLGDLTAPRWSVQSGGKIRIEPKDDIKKRLGRSPDDGDAAVMAFWREPKRKIILAAPGGAAGASNWRV